MDIKRLIVVCPLVLAERLPSLSDEAQQALGLPTGVEVVLVDPRCHDFVEQSREGDLMVILVDPGDTSAYYVNDALFAVTIGRASSAILVVHAQDAAAMQQSLYISAYAAVTTGNGKPAVSMTYRVRIGDQVQQVRVVRHTWANMRHALGYPKVVVLPPSVGRAQDELEWVLRELVRPVVEQFVTDQHTLPEPPS